MPGNNSRAGASLLYRLIRCSRRLPISSIYVLLIPTIHHRHRYNVFEGGGTESEEATGGGRAIVKQRQRRRRHDDEASISSKRKDVLLEGAKALILKTLGTRHGKQFWKDLPPEWKEDRDVILGGLEHNRIGLEDLPAELQNDRAFLIAAVSANSKLWRSLPPTTKDDIDFARSITAFTDTGVLDEILTKFPDLCNERNTWFAIFSTPQFGDLGEYTRELSQLERLQPYGLIMS